MEPIIVQEIAEKVQENVASIQRVPYLTDAERTQYQALAQAGQDVYAYAHESSTTWNVWYEDIRIPYGPDPRRWSLETVTPQPASTWEVTLRDAQKQTTRIVIWTCFQPAEVAQRRILAAVQFCNTFHIEPIDKLI